MSTTAKTTGRGLASNWDLALASSALLLIVGGIAAPHIRRLLAGDEAGGPDGLGSAAPYVRSHEDLPAVV